MITLVLLALYGVYHAIMESFDSQVLLIWLTSGSGMMLSLMDCEGDIDLVMMMSGVLGERKSLLDS